MTPAACLSPCPFTWPSQDLTVCRASVLPCLRLKTPPRPQGQRTEPESRGGVSFLSVCTRVCVCGCFFLPLNPALLCVCRCSRASATPAFTCPSVSAPSPLASSPQSLTPTTLFTEQVNHRGRKCRLYIQLRACGEPPPAQPRNAENCCVMGCKMPTRLIRFQNFLSP